MRVRSNFSVFPFHLGQVAAENDSPIGVLNFAISMRIISFKLSKSSPAIVVVFKLTDKSGEKSSWRSAFCSFFSTILLFPDGSVGVFSVSAMAFSPPIMTPSKAAAARMPALFGFSKFGISFLLTSLSS